MRISFDIDDTLVLHGRNVPSKRERFPAFIHRWFSEPLRLGTRPLMLELRRLGWNIWIYTSSGRTPFAIRRWLWLYGIRIDGVVNDQRHFRELTRRNFPRMPSKYPPAFGIDLHVDDSPGVEMEGKEHGFRVIVVNPMDEQWTNKILNQITEPQHTES